jgi:hypothetical protein
VPDGHALHGAPVFEGIEEKNGIEIRDQGN